MQSKDEKAASNDPQTLLKEIKAAIEIAETGKDSEKEFVEFQKNVLDSLEEKYAALLKRKIPKKEENALKEAYEELDAAVTKEREKWATKLTSDFKKSLDSRKIDPEVKKLLGRFQVYATEVAFKDDAQDNLFNSLKGFSDKALKFAFSDEASFKLIQRALSIRENSAAMLTNAQQIRDDAIVRAGLIARFDREIKNSKKKPGVTNLLQSFLSYVNSTGKPQSYTALDGAIAKIDGNPFAELTSDQRKLINEASRFHKGLYMSHDVDPSKNVTLSDKIAENILAKHPEPKQPEQKPKKEKDNKAVLLQQIMTAATNERESLAKAKDPFKASFLRTPPLLESRNQLRKLEKSLESAKNNYKVLPEEQHKKAQAAIEALKNNIEALETPKKAFIKEQIQTLQNLKDQAQDSNEKAEMKTQIRAQAADAMKNIRSLRKFDTLVSKAELAAARKNIKVIDNRYKEVKKTLKKEIEVARKESVDVELREEKISEGAPPPPPVFDDSALKQQYENNIEYLKRSFKNKDSAELSALGGVLLSDAKEVAKQVEPGSAAEEKVVKQWLLDIKGQVRVIDQIAALKAIENRSLQGFNEAEKVAQKYKENPTTENAAELTRIEEKAKDLESAAEMHRDLIIEYSKGVRMDSREKDKFVRDVIRLQGNCSVHVSEIVSELREARGAPLKKTEAKIETQVDKDLAQLKIYHKEMQDIVMASKASPSETADKLAQGYIREARGLLVLIETETGKNHDEARALVNSIVKMQREVTPQSKKSSTAMFLSAVHADPKKVKQGIEQDREEAKKVAEHKKPEGKPKPESAPQQSSTKTEGDRFKGRRRV